MDSRQSAAINVGTARLRTGFCPQPRHLPRITTGVDLE